MTTLVTQRKLTTGILTYIWWRLELIHGLFDHDSNLSRRYFTSRYDPVTLHAKTRFVTSDCIYIAVSAIRTVYYFWGNRNKTFRFVTEKCLAAKLAYRNYGSA